MKALLLAAIAVITSLSSYCHAQQSVVPQDGVYQGYLTITRNTPALKLKTVTTLLIVGDIKSNGPAICSFYWTAKNFDQTSRLTNAWADYDLDLSSPLQTVPDFEIGRGYLYVPGGNVVPGSYKVTTSSLSYKCERSADYVEIPTTFTTTFSFRRVGPPPAPQPAAPKS